MLFGQSANFFMGRKNIVLIVDIHKRSTIIMVLLWIEVSKKVSTVQVSTRNKLNPTQVGTKEEDIFPEFQLKIDRDNMDIQVIQIETFADKIHQK